MKLCPGDKITGGTNSMGNVNNATNTGLDTLQAKQTLDPLRTFRIGKYFLRWFLNSPNKIPLVCTYMYVWFGDGWVGLGWGERSRNRCTCIIVQCPCMTTQIHFSFNTNYTYLVLTHAKRPLIQIVYNYIMRQTQCWGFGLGLLNLLMTRYGKVETYLYLTPPSPPDWPLF